MESVNGRFVRLHIHSTFPKTNFIRGAGTPCDPGAAAEKIIAAPSPPDRFRAAYVPYEHRGRGAGGRKVRRASLLGQNPRHVIFTPPPPPPCAMPAACPLFPANRGRYRHRPHGQPPSDGEGAPNRGRGRGGGDLLAPFFAGTEAAPVTPASIVFLVSDKTPFPFLLSPRTRCRENFYSSLALALPTARKWCVYTCLEGLPRRSSRTVYLYTPPNRSIRLFYHLN